MLFFNLISIPKHYFLYKKIVRPCRESSLVHTWPKIFYIIVKISRHIKKTRRGGGHEKKNILIFYLLDQRQPKIKIESPIWIKKKERYTLI